MKGEPMDAREKAKNIVDGFFIGGLKDDLQQPNLTKEDLIFTIEKALESIFKRTKKRALKEVNNSTGEDGEWIECSEELSGAISSITFEEVSK